MQRPAFPFGGYLAAFALVGLAVAAAHAAGPWLQAGNQPMLFLLAVLISALGFKLPLPLGVVGHEGSTVLVCLNGLRLLAFNWKLPVASPATGLATP